MRHIQSWDDLLGLADFINGKLPSPPDTLANDWNTRCLTNVNKKYSNYIPLSIGERVVHQATPNGNCIYNAASIILFGNESMAMMLKLASVVKMVDDLVPFSKYIVEEFKENTFLWVHSSTRVGIIVGRNTS